MCNVYVCYWDKVSVMDKKKSVEGNENIVCYMWWNDWGTKWLNIKMVEVITLGTIKCLLV